MEVRTKLLSMSGAEFEELATSVLRIANPEYASVFQTGISAKGKPVKSPLDGFCRVPHSAPPHYITIAHTTTSESRLKRKWLHDHTKVAIRISGSARRSKMPSSSDDGDVLKAGREILEIKQNYPNAKFTIVLTVNKILSDTALANKVYDKAKEFGDAVDVDFWPLDKLVHWLNFSSEGHWIRKKLLNIPAEILSPQLLREICTLSLDNYRENSRFLTPPQEWIYRNINLINDPDNPATVQFLVGASGFGKSALAYQIMQQYMENNGYALWIPAFLVGKHFSIKGVLEEVLNELYPSIQANESDSIESIIPEDKPLLLVFDDINRTDHPIEVINRIIGWFGYEQPRNDSNLSLARPKKVAICPIWPQVAGSISMLEKQPWVSFTQVQAMLMEEAIEALQKTTFLSTSSRLIMTELVYQLGGDPFLIGLVSIEQDATESIVSSTRQVSRKIVKQYITNSISEIGPGNYTIQECWESLLKIISFMLEKRTLNPKWSDIRISLGQDSVEWDILSRLTLSSTILILDRERGILNFRHDRLFETIAVDYFIHILKETPVSEIVWDPYFADSVGAALAEIQEFNEDLLWEFAEKLPLVLAEAIRTFGEPTTSIHHAIIRTLKRWAEWGKHPSYDSSPSVLTVLNSLAKTDSSAINSILPKISGGSENGLLISLAQFRNGNVRSGMMYCSLFGFQIHDNDIWHQLVPHVAQTQGPKIIADLKNILTSNVPNDKEVAGALLLSGYLGNEDLSEALVIGWNNGSSKIKILKHAIWACLRCFDESKSYSFDPIFEYWADLSDIEEEKRKDYRESVVDGFSGFSRLLVHPQYQLSPKALLYLQQQTQIHPELRPHIAYIFGHIDNPFTIEFAIRFYSELRALEPDSKDVDFLLHYWNPVGFRNNQLASETLNHINTLWQSTSENTSVRTYAFQLWLLTTNQQHLNILQSIQEQSPLFDYALWRRVILSDSTALSHLLFKLQEDDSWLRIMHRLWAQPLKEYISRRLESLSDGIKKDFTGGRNDIYYLLADVLMMIPSIDAEELLSKHWGHLQFSPVMIHAALAVGSHKLSDMVNDTLQMVPESANIFEHLFIQLEMIGIKADFLLLERLKPYVHRFDEHTLLRLTEVCLKLGKPGIEWIYKNLSEVLEIYNKRKYYAPTLNDHVESLDQRANEPYSMRKWFEAFDVYGFEADPFNILEDWFRSHSSWERFQKVALAIELYGQRKHLKILDIPLEQDIDWLVAQEKEKLKFIVYRRTLN